MSSAVAPTRSTPVGRSFSYPRLLLLSARRTRGTTSRVTVVAPSSSSARVATSTTTAIFAPATATEVGASLALVSSTVTLHLVEPIGSLCCAGLRLVHVRLVLLRTFHVTYCSCRLWLIISPGLSVGDRCRGSSGGVSNLLLGSLDINPLLRDGQVVAVRKAIGRSLADRQRLGRSLNLCNVVCLANGNRSLRFRRFCALRGGSCLTLGKVPNISVYLLVSILAFWVSQHRDDLHVDCKRSPGTLMTFSSVPSINFIIAATAELSPE